MERRGDTVRQMTDIPTGHVPDEVGAALDACGQHEGATRPGQHCRAVTREHLERFAARTADLGDPQLLAAAWR
jgi:hypothetical protein